MGIKNRVESKPTSKKMYLKEIFTIDSLPNTYFQHEFQL